MKYRSFLLGTVAALSLSTAAVAAGPTPEGAAAIVKSLTGFLPDNVIKTGFIAAIPEGDHYRLSVDLGKLAGLLKPEKGQFDLSALYEMQIFPPAGDEGLMAVKRESGPLSINAKWSVGDQKGDVSYLIKDLVFNGDFDPAISYFRSGMGHASGGSITSYDGKQNLTASFGPSDYTMSGARNGQGSVDLVSSARISELAETISGPEMPLTTLTMGNIGIDGKVTGIKIQEISALLNFVLAHADEKTLTPEQRRSLADLVRKAMPLMTAFTEEVRVDNLAVTTSGITGRVDNLTYHLGMAGLTDDSELHFGMSLKNPQLIGLPQVVAYGDLIPKDISMTMSLGGLNFETVINSILDQADYDAKEPLTEAQWDAIGKAFLKDGRLKVELPEFQATSPLYSISVKGHVSAETQAEPAKANAEFDVTARDLDKTIAGIQSLAQSVPDLNTASFGLMMAKGMAKNDPDGTSRWKIEVAEDGQVKINGQVMPH
ncbi:hypothetical protein [Gellertiella hungarica]|uniref:DUF945 domain-containing protein n=1 Tax=Gellertiella hungarica TaxID=1572859 RepID=A0A7W6J253_9HYPH|nr:hypothetical protein [Gellertiella hungarica]MBB4063406.1 hypothetical protein [Gellertiella hungarica]